MSDDRRSYPLAENEAVLAFGTIVTLIVIIHNIVLLIVHCHQLAKSKPRSHVQRLSLLSMTVTLAFLIVLFSTAYSWTFDVPHPVLNPIGMLQCRWTYKLSGVFWCNHKFALYLLFMERLFAIFANGADLQFKASHIRFTRMWLGACWLTEETLMLLFVDASPSEDNSSICIDETAIWMPIVYVTADLSFCTSISVMFTRRLLALHVQNTAETVIAGDVNQIAKQSTDASVTLGIASKSTLLSCVALITSEVAIFCSMSTGITHLWLALDCMVNCWCIILMFKPYDAIFKRMCCLCQRVIGMRFLSCYSCHCCCRIQ